MNFLHILSVVWGLVLAAFVAVMVYRGHLQNHETEQLFLSDNVDEALVHRHDVVARRATVVQPLFTGLGSATAVISFVIISTYLIQQMPNMRF